MDSAHRENTVVKVSLSMKYSQSQCAIPLHMLLRFSIFRGSIWCILFASTVKTGAANRVGIVAVTAYSDARTVCVKEEGGKLLNVADRWDKIATSRCCVRVKGGRLSRGCTGGC
jgi:hypothetical protein